MMKRKFFLLAFSLIPTASYASTEGLGSVLFGYLSIYLIIPVLILTPTIKLVFQSNKDSKLKKWIGPSIAVALISISVLFALATQYFSFNFSPPYKAEPWEILFLLALPSAYFLFQQGEKSNAT